MLFSVLSCFLFGGLVSCFLGVEFIWGGVVGFIGDLAVGGF